MDGVRAEYTYLAAHPCASGGRWQLKEQTLVTHAGTPYDVIDAICSSGGAERKFYFDIHAYYGKI